MSEQTWHRFVLGACGIIGWLFVHVCLVFLIAAGHDGCTKCIRDNDAARFEAMDVTFIIFAIVGVIDALLIYGLWTLVRNVSGKSATFLVATGFYGVAFAASLFLAISGDLRCGHDCLPPHPFAKTADALSYPAIPAFLIALILFASCLIPRPVNGEQST